VTVFKMGCFSKHLFLFSPQTLTLSIYLATKLSLLAAKSFFGLLIITYVQPTTFGWNP